MPIEQPIAVQTGRSFAKLVGIILGTRAFHPVFDGFGGVDHVERRDERDHSGGLSGEQCDETVRNARDNRIDLCTGQRSLDPGRTDLGPLFKAFASTNLTGRVSTREATRIGQPGPHRTSAFITPQFMSVEADKRLGHQRCQLIEPRAQQHQRSGIGRHTCSEHRRHRIRKLGECHLERTRERTWVRTRERTSLRVRHRDRSGARIGGCWLVGGQSFEHVFDTKERLSALGIGHSAQRSAAQSSPAQRPAAQRSITEGPPAQQPTAQRSAAQRERPGLKDQGRDVSQWVLVTSEPLRWR